MIVLPALPIRNPNVGMVYNYVHFSEKDCDQIIKSINQDAWQAGGVGGYSVAGTGSVNNDARKCTEQRLPIDQQSGWPLNKIMFECCNINAQAWRFDLGGFVNDDLPYVMRYQATNKDHIDWHMDMGQAQNASRKLGFSIQLSNPDDYEGGDLEFHNVSVEKKDIRKRGTLILFPAYWLHRVTAITSGERQVVVGWVHGPSYR
ncbi:MAG: hypothetical protein CL567_04940 [Alphaproteobacteria bacterium]|nr:hypothetical protein [Alphaproteobacteria bacterium]|tara:strand:+ start:4628 stop:5236 length:609 start_codon:yes stop_codon:yes gene_type:complete